MPQPTIALIIPSLYGATDALLASIARQTMPPQQVEIVLNVSPIGAARNRGVARTTSDYLVFVDDDAVLGNEHVIANMLAPLQADPTIGITGASRLLHPNASAWEQWVAREVPRIEHAVVFSPLETNPDPPSYYCEITTTCCAMRREVFAATGGFSQTIFRGEDTEYFVRVRQAGYRIMLVPHTWVYHPAPSTCKLLLRKHFLYGMGFAQEVQNDPQRARGRYLHTPLHAAAYLAFRSAILLPNVFLPFSFAAPSWKLGFKPLKAITSYATALGYVWGWYANRP